MTQGEAGDVRRGQSEAEETGAQGTVSQGTVSQGTVSQGTVAQGAEGSSRPVAVSRRRLIQVAAGVVGGSVAAVALGERLRPSASSVPEASVATARLPLFSSQLFSLEQALFVEDLAEHIIPETDSPGATSAGVPAYIEDIVREVNDEPERQLFLSGIDRANAEARASYGRPFHECGFPGSGSV